MDLFDSIRLLALRAVMKPDGAAAYRSICRWYSTTFHTPLHTVDELPQEDVLQAHFEHIYGELDEVERQELLRKLLETDEEKKARARAKDAEDAEAFEFARQMAYEEKQRQAKARISDVKVPSKSSMFNVPQRDLSLVAPALSAPAFEKLEPDVAIKFVDAEDFEKELEGFGTMIPKESK